MSDISSKTAPRSRFSVREICYSGLFAAVIAIMAQISIPMPGGVPMTMQTFAIICCSVPSAYRCLRTFPAVLTSLSVLPAVF